ncbi:MAG: EAL domain-containing protein, partial [Gammaproteobacteria bacterium]
PLGFIRHLYLNGNTLWIGTLSGLYRVPDVNIEQLHVERMFGAIEPLQSNIYAIQQDSEGALWIATNRGLTRIFPDTGDFRHFSSADGLQSEEFNGDASLLDSQGRMWFAGPSGVNSFVPGNFSISDFEPPVWFTAIKTSTQHKTIHLPALFKSITLGPSQDMLSVRFAALDYTSPERIQYRIRMNNEQWVDIGHRNEIAYANLAPGRYILQVAASNADGRFGEHFRALRIDITPPWWQTTSAYLAYFVIFMLLVWGYIQWRKQKLGESLEHQREVRRAKRWLEWALWGTGDALWIWDLISNRTKRIGLEKLLGYQENELTDESSHLEWLIHPEDLPKVDELIQKHLTHPESSHFEAEYRMRAADGSWRWILDRGRVVEHDEHGRPLRVAGTFRDITDRKKTEEELKLFALVIRNMSEMVVVTDANLRILSFNPAFQTTLAVDSDKLEGQNLAEFIAPIRATNRIVSWQKDIAVAGHWSGELTVGPATEKARYVWSEMTAIFDTQRSLRYVVCVMTDLTDQKKAEAELHYLTHFDHLTQLPNRLMFMELLEKAVAKARRTNHCVGVLLIELDNFKHVNDSLGHDAGDLLLQAFAQRMKDKFSSQYKFCRLGGDEFAIIAEHFKTGDSLQTLLQEIRELITTPFDLNGQDVNITVSIGISLYPDDAEDARSLLKYADTAVHAAKSSGRNAYQFYSHDMNQRITRRLEIEAALRHALARNEFSLVYQPKFDLINGTITGVEALLRWKSQQIGDVRPDEFIPIAEETGLIDDIGTWVFDRACQDALTWQAQLNEPLNIAINLSPRQFKSHDLVEQLQQSLQKYNLSATQFTLEITETLLMENAEHTIHICDSLKATGFQLSIDDFGTGYSSLSYLKRFPIDSLKIDRSFVRDIIDDMDDAAITSAIIGLAHNLALVVVAEGVETAQQLVFLRASGCDEIQGYLISPPTTAEDVIRIVESARRGEFNRFFHH